METINPMANAWLQAAKDLNIRVIHPFPFITKSGHQGITQGVFLPDFGNRFGTLLTCRFDSDEIYDLVEDTDYYSSGLNPNSNEPYNQKLYIETLNDWCWFGKMEQRPSWYTGADWKRLYIIDGNHFSTLSAFFDEIGSVVIPGADWGRNLNAFNDILRCGFGTPEGGFKLKWKNSAISRQRLGNSDYQSIINIILTHCPGGEEQQDHIELFLE